MTKLLTLVMVATITILAIMFIKYRFVYKVSISGKEIGYVINKNKFEENLKEQIANPSQDNIAYIEMTEEPTYTLILADSSVKTNESEIIDIINTEAVVTYKIYSVSVDGNNTAYVNSIEEAEETVEKIKDEYKEKLDEIDINVEEIYTKDLEQVEQTVEVESAVEETETLVVAVVKEQERKNAATLNGVYFETKPVTGNITSRYGDMESIRSHAHSGLDICAPAGTDIVAAADGEVTSAGWNGGYGNLIIITHENGVQTYYGHCSKLYASVGDVVKAGDLIAAVGRTGFATGNHLHFEIRVNGSTINPQRYLYN